MSTAPWKNAKEKVDSTPESKVTFDDIKKLIDTNKKRKKVAGTCAVYYGDRGTGKTGAALDCRTPAEIKDGKKVFIIDVDGNAKWTTNTYWGTDPNVILVDPIRCEEDGTIKDKESYDYTRSSIAYAKSIQDDLKCVIFDGLGKFLKICEGIMRQEYLHIPIGERVSAFDWGIRNTLNNNPLYLMNTMSCMRIFITHMKTPRKLVQKMMVDLEPVPDLQRLFPNTIVQELMFTKLIDSGRTTIDAQVRKSNTNLSLEGRRFTIGTNSKADGAKWNGLKEFYEALGDWSS